MYYGIRLLVFLALLVGSSTIFAQIPRMISYQGILADGSGNLVADGSYTLELRLYDVATGGSPLYTETHTAAVVNGVFNAIIGSVTALPGSLAFDRAYYLGVTVNGGTELSPRTALVAAPYALNAAHALRADTATFALTSGGGGGGGVVSVNTIDGAVTLVGGGGTTINNDVPGKTITISSSGGGGTGIQGVQNTDGTISITNPNGPTATINISNNTIDANKLETDIGSLVKVSGGLLTGTPTEISSFGDLTFLTDDLSITFPEVSGVSDAMINMFSGGTANADRMVIAHSPAFQSWGIQYRDADDEMHFLGNGNSVMNVDLDALRVGIGGIDDPAATLEVKGSATSNVFIASTTGTGIPGQFQIANASNSSNALIVTTNGTGKAAAFSQTNASSAAHAVTISQAGSGYGLDVTHSGSSNAAGNFMNTNASNITPAVRGEVAGNGPAVAGYTTGGGGRAGSFRIANAANTTHAVLVETNGTANTSHGILAQHSATSGFGAGVRGETNSATSGSSAEGATGLLGVVTPTAPGTWSAGVRGVNNSTSGAGIGVVGYHAGSGYGVYGTTAGAGYAIYSGGEAFKTAGGNTWTIPSDSRLKDNIRPFTDGLAVLEQIAPKQYVYNGVLGTRKGVEEIGIIAEDMARIAPYTVKPHTHQLDNGASMDILTYNSGALTYVTINAVKELAAELRQLRLELDAAITLLREHGIDPEGKLPAVTGR